VDQQVLRWLNDLVQSQPLRSVAEVAAIGLVAGPALILGWSAVRTVRRRSGRDLSIIALTVCGAGLGLLADYGASHLYFRPRPYLVVSSVQALLPRDGDTSFMPWQVIVAAACSTGIVLISRSWAAVSAVATLLVMVGSVAVAQNYPSDTLVNAVAGVAFVALLLPLHRRVERRLSHWLGWEAEMPEESAAPAGRASRPRRRWAVAAAVVLAALGGWTVARLQGHGTTVALTRADARLQQRPPSDHRIYRQVSIDDLAAGKIKATHARVYGTISDVHAYEPDGDVHMEIRAPDDAFVVLEVPPEFPLASLPSKGEQITVWGIVRHDGLHNWWELHPVVGWLPGRDSRPSSPDLQD
jgi:membrane-associated phospholipid phosphatase